MLSVSEKVLETDTSSTQYGMMRRLPMRERVTSQASGLPLTHGSKWYHLDVIIVIIN